MRIVGSLVILVGLVALCLGAGAGCKNKGNGDNGAADPAALKAQQDLIARRDKLLEARKRLQGEHDNLAQQVKESEAKGEDATELKKKLADLDSQLETSTAEALSLVSGKVDAMTQAVDKATAIAGREAEVGSRERMLGDREARIAEREKLLAQRDYDSAQRWKESCGTGAAPVIIQQAAPKNGSYTNRDVSAQIQKAKTAMAKKGLINSDLPAQAQQLESDASKAMNENDMSKAYFAASQLVATVDAIQVNRAFIQAKTARLSAAVKTTKVDEQTNKELASILGDVMNSYNNGDFGAANRRLNNLAAKLKGA